jgi:YidC/Oxa1 family membrane protein insertase
MKQYDKNSLIGFVLMAIILIVFNTFFFPEVPQKQTPTNIPTKVVLTESQTSDTTTATAIDTVAVNSTINDTTISDELKATYGVFVNSARGEDTLYTIENDKLKITVASKGGRITSVIIKEGPNKEQYKTYDGKDLEIFNSRK